MPELEKLSTGALRTELSSPTDRRLFAIAEALRRGLSVTEINYLTKIDIYFLRQIEKIIFLEEELKTRGWQGLNKELLFSAKYYGFGDHAIGKLIGLKEKEVRSLREKHTIKPVYKMVDACAAEFPAENPCFYSTYDQENEAEPSSNKMRAAVLGAGPIRIGQGIEFDYCSAHAAWALKEEGIESIIINNNPETVSTDFDT